MIDKFISVGENIHCTRKYKIGGKFVVENGNDYAVKFKSGGEDQLLPIPSAIRESPEWETGMVRHCAVAIWQGVYGEGKAKELGIEYIREKAREQEACGATYLDVNVDEYSTDIAERVKLMEWTANLVQEASSLPLSIDSSNEDILRAGLAACDKSRATPMLNSVSLERQSAIPLVAEFGTVVVASAAGESDLPCTMEGRIENMQKIYPMLKDVGVTDEQIHFDPLVFPMSTDPMNGPSYLDTCAKVREVFGQEVHMVAGLSNISFGMPNRKLLNQVFTYLTVEKGGDGGIVDPLHINLDILNGFDTSSKPFVLAKAALTGEDEFGMDFIMASRDGSI